MPTKNRYEQQFLDALQALFVGARVEGASGYVNLMRIKSRYYTQAVFPQLLRDVDAACRPFEPGFREELFDKLYDFFSRYFSESGSLYFRHTAPHHAIYDRVYTDDRDVLLFWKTHMLYYVKTDRLFTSMDVEVDGERFFFDVAALEHKRANEKRALVYDFARREPDGWLVFTVSYAERGRKTNMDDIARAIKATGVSLDAETLARAFRVFEQQAEVDYFINKDARAFLREQFDLWMYQYLFRGRSDYTATRLQQLQTLQAIAYGIIDFIAQFEDELVKVWNKPKFALNSHYVLTLDKFFPREGEGESGREGEGVLRRVLAHPGMAAQMAEWRELGMLGDLTDLDDLTGLLFAHDLLGAPLYLQYRYLPLDTKHFPDLELDILALFDDLDAALDGWLVHSENYQALRTLLPKFEGRVKCVHIDPPYNTDTSGFLYVNAYQHASWLTMMENRIAISVAMLSDDGSYLCHIDENEYERLHLLFEETSLPNAGTIVWDKRNPMNAGRGVATQHEYVIWRSKQTTPIYLRNDSILEMLNTAAGIIQKHGGVSEAAQKEYATWVNGNPELTGGEKAYRYLDEQGRIYQSVSLRAPEPRTDPKFFKPLIHPVTKKPCPVPPNGFSRTPETLQTMIEKSEILFGADETIQPRQKVLLTVLTTRQISSLIQDARKGKADLDPLGLDFPYCHPTSFYETLTGAVTSSNDIILDFFAGSGTTAHAVMNLNRADGGKRKYILVEMGAHFHDVILPRIKKVAFCEKWKDGVASVSPPPGGTKGGLSQFVKYYDLEQYEDTLRRARYEDHPAPLFAGSLESLTQYVFLRDLKLLDAVTVHVERPRSINVDLAQLYPGIDLAETLSCLTGKWIKRITPEAVEFADGTTASLSDPEWELVKPLVWW